MQFQQALLQRASDGNLAIHLCSHEFKSEWHSRALSVCEAFSTDPPPLELAEVLFVQRLDKNLFMIIRSMASRRIGTAPARFHVLVASRANYSRAQCDPFLLAERFPSDWNATSELPELEWPEQPLPIRTVAEVQKILKRTNGPEMLGGSQALIDGSQLLFPRSAPDLELVRGVWRLLPYGNRLEVMPASFAWNNALKFELVVAPADRSDRFTGFMTEEQAGGYPEGRYELSLQTAAEANDQESLDILFARRSRREVWRLGILLVVVMGILALAIQIMSPVAKHAK
ncbi:hypothetical protein BH10PLA2_BH10PLA2_18760 [soil metagenome]